MAKLTARVGKQQELLEQAAHLSGEMELREEEIERLRGEVDAQMVQVRLGMRCVCVCVWGGGGGGLGVGSR